jgi:NADH-quinone oxidoreductase subunit L
MELALKLIIFLPLMSGVFNGIFGKIIDQKIAKYVASISIISVAILTVPVFIRAGIEQDALHVLIASWIRFDSIAADWAIYVDQLTAIMFFLVAFVSAVVHIYSLGYMSDDENLPKFLSYLSLFTFFMLALVSADNFLQLFFGWEGVGLCSYLLIGYYYHKDSANAAAVKAFIVNRVSDFAFIVGMVMIFIYTGSFDFGHVFLEADDLSNIAIKIFGTRFAVLDIICFLLFLGCMGKSAQIGFHVWLPDAMEGPTPVSALIHAATMVTAGVFLVARCSFMFEYSQLVLDFMTIIGAVTCLFAALIAIAQVDIKKIIAYSTCSQLGYMFFACGVSAYQVGIFHLVTHGFFKALLFLSAGSVIHASHTQDLFKMGNLRRKMPITYANFWIGSLAIIGIYPFAGFYSKDLILESAYKAGGRGDFAFTLGVIAALLTAIYSMKIIVLAFHGETKLKKAVFEKVHESPSVMNLPLAILVAGALFAGMIGYYILSIHSPYGFFMNSIFNLNISASQAHVPLWVELLPMIIGVSGILFGIYIYAWKIAGLLASKFYFVHCLLKNKFFFDELYNKLIIRVFRIFSFYSFAFDQKVIDRFGPNGFAVLCRWGSCLISKIQTGYIFNYAVYVIFALVVCITVLITKFLFGV